MVQHPDLFRTESGLFSSLRLAPGGVAGNTGAKGPKQTEGVNPRIVGVAPQKLQCVVAHRHVVHRLDILGDSRRVQPRPAAHLVDALGALATETEEAVGINTAVAVIPEDDYAALWNTNFSGENDLFHLFPIPVQISLNDTEALTPINIINSVSLCFSGCSGTGLRRLDFGQPGWPRHLIRVDGDLNDAGAVGFQRFQEGVADVFRPLHVKAGAPE